IAWHIYYLRIRRLDLNDLLRHFCNLSHISLFHDDVRDRDNLLLRTLECSSLLGLQAEFLDGIHHVLGLIDKRLPQFRCPVKIRIHLRNQFREFGNFFDVVIPGLLVDFRNVVCVFHESSSLNDFQRIRCCRQNDGDEPVRVQRYRHDEFLQVSLAPLGLRRWRRRGIGGRVGGCWLRGGGGNLREAVQTRKGNQQHEAKVFHTITGNGGLGLRTNRGAENSVRLGLVGFRSTSMKLQG